MNDRERQEAAAQRLELLAIYHRSRRELERREAGYEVVEVPLDLRSALVEVREGINDAQARLQQIQAEDTSGEVVRLVHEMLLRQAREEIDHIQALQKVRRRKAAELEKRKAMCDPHQTPLKLIHGLNSEIEALAALDARLRQAETQQAETERILAGESPVPVADETPATLHLFIVTPDGARYETQVAADTLVAQLQAAFLTEWRPPADVGLVRHALRLEASTRPLQPVLTLVEAVVQDGARLRLVQEVLSPASPVGLTVEDADGNRYTTAVRLDTPVSTLAQAFMETVRSGGQAAVELLIGPEERRQLRHDATLYEQHVGDGAQLRIVPVS